MTLKEINNEILKNKTKAFNILCLNAKVELIRMRKVFSLSFNIPEDTIYSTPTYINFFNTFIINNRRKAFDLEKIKLDLLKHNKHDEDFIIRMAIKYMEPKEVIEEILELVKTNNTSKLFIDNKLYYSRDLANIFDCHICNVTSLPKFSTLSFTPYCGQNNTWLGKVINDNLNWLSGFKYFKIFNKDNIKFYTLSDASTKLGMRLNAVSDRTTKQQKIFGVKMTLVREEGINSSVYINAEDVDKAVSNKKYYIKSKDIINGLPEFWRIYKNNMRVLSCFNYLYKKSFSLKAGYVSKETFNLVKTFFNNYFDNYEAFINTVRDKLKFIEKDTFTLKEAQTIVRYRLNTLTKLEEIIYSKDIITKDDLIEILDLRLKKSFNAKKCKD